VALNPESIKSKAGLVLTGGGARAAYQVGVLKAVRELLPLPEKNPFPIVCGTSAGAVNAATLAVFADNFDAASGGSWRFGRAFTFITFTVPTRSGSPEWVCAASPRLH